jgi:hypothetical protein
MTVILSGPCDRRIRSKREDPVMTVTMMPLISMTGVGGGGGDDKDAATDFNNDDDHDVDDD